MPIEPVHHTPLPIAPSSFRPDTYDVEIDAFTAAWEPLADEIDALADNAYANAGEAVGAADDAIAARDAAEGYRDAAAASESNAATSATNAAASEANAAASEAAAAASANTADGFRATSPTSVAIGLGAKSLTLAQTGKLFTVGSYIEIVDAADATNFMSAKISTFNAGTGAMTVDVKGIGGSGTKSSWTVTLSGATATPVTSGTLSGVLNLAPTVTVASASTTDIGGANSNNVAISGTTTITSFGSSASAPEGSIRDITFTGALTLTHNATSLILPGAANIVTVAGDTARAKSLGSGNWRVIAYSRASGLPISNDAVMKRSLKTASFNVTAADAGTVFELSASTAQTITVDALSTLPTNFSFWWVSTGTGIWTIDPNASEQIDGVPSFSILPGEARLVQRDGSAFKSTIVKPFYYTMTASGTFPILPPGYAALSGYLWCSGAGGGVTLPGPGGAAVPFSIERSKLTSTTTVTIGSGVSGTSATNVVAGNNSSFGSLVVAYAGGLNLISLAKGVVSNSSGGNSSQQGDAYAGGHSSATSTAIFGGAAGSDSGAGPASIFGGNGGAYTAGANGGAGQAPGGGGASCDSGFTGGAGARGELRCWGIPG